MDVKKIFDGDRIILILDNLSDDDKEKVDAFVNNIGANVSTRYVRGLAPLPTYSNPSNCTYKYVSGPYKGKTFFDSLQDGEKAVLYALEHLSEFPQKEVELVKSKVRNSIIIDLKRRNSETDTIADVRGFEKLFNIKPFEHLFHNIKNVSGFSDVSTFFKYGNGEVVREAYAFLINKILDVVSKL